MSLAKWWIQFFGIMCSLKNHRYNQKQWFHQKYLLQPVGRPCCNINDLISFLAPGNVSNVEVVPLNSTSLKVTWTPTNQPGYGIIGHKIIYNRKDQIKDEKDWKYISIVSVWFLETLIHKITSSKFFNSIT